MTPARGTQKVASTEASPPATQVASTVALSEHLDVTKRTVEGARAVLTKSVTQHDQLVDTILSHDEVTVERVPINIYVDFPPGTRIEGETTIFPIVREVVVVTTRLLVVEEVRVTKRIVQSVDHRIVPLRVEHVQAERFEPRPSQAPTPTTTKKEII